MQNSQYIHKEYMEQVHICLLHRRARGEKIKIAELLNEIVGLGLRSYAMQKGIQLPQWSKNEVEVEGAVGE